MDKIILRKVQLAILDIAKDVKEVCDKLKIQYFLDSGTLLGAVRHKGFIPWDDDLDIGMTRNNYEIFIHEAPKMLGDKYFLQTWDSDPNYAMPFAKVRRNNSSYIEEGSSNTNIHSGIYVDIFPWDVMPDSKEKQSWQKKRVWIYKRLMMMKCHYTPWKNENKIDLKKFLAYLPIRFLSFFFSKKQLKEKYQSICTAFNNESSVYLYEQGGGSDYGEFCCPRQCINNYKYLVFEDEDFMCPEDCESYLKQIYGNYMELPPIEKRYNRHHIITIEFPKD